MLSDMVSDAVTNPYLSINEDCLSKERLRSFLLSNNLLDSGKISKDHPDERYWPGDDKETEA